MGQRSRVKRSGRLSSKKLKGLGLIPVHRLHIDLKEIQGMKPGSEFGYPGKIVMSEYTAIRGLEDAIDTICRHTTLVTFNTSCIFLKGIITDVEHTSGTENPIRFGEQIPLVFSPVYAGEDGKEDHGNECIVPERDIRAFLNTQVEMRILGLSSDNHLPGSIKPDAMRESKVVQLTKDTAIAASQIENPSVFVHICAETLMIERMGKLLRPCYLIPICILIHAICPLNLYAHAYSACQLA
jgi:hypothetical protein